MSTKISTDRPVARARRVLFKSERERWQAEYVRRVAVTDTIVVIAAVALAQLIRFGGLDTNSTLDMVGDSGIRYTAVSVVLAMLWLVLLSLLNTRSPRIVGNGAEEYGRIVRATLHLFGSIAIASLVLRVDFARGYLAIALPVGLAGLLLSRHFWRRYAVRQRRTGQYQTSVLIVGRRSAAESLVRAFGRVKGAGFRVVGICTPDGSPDATHSIVVDDLEVPVVGDTRSILHAVEISGADTVVVTAVEQLGEDGIRNLVWDLEPLGVHLVVTPGMIDAGGPRMIMRPVPDLPLVLIEKPQYDRANAFAKTAFDWFFAAAALLGVLPIMLAIGVAVKTTSRGPVFYRSERMGLDGKPFHMIKFRTMNQDADKHLGALLQQNEGDGVRFKLRDDPRVTSVGRVLRRYSLDELPQFINVLRGEMSVVGPRPPLRREVDQYNGTVKHRMLVKPGVTGLWQVSGRSDLSWEEAVRLDLSYVENWSMVQDLLIIKKTMSAVARSEGAY